MDQNPRPLWEIVAWAFISAFAAFFWVLYQPPNRRPTPSEIAGRVGVGVIAGIFAGAVATDYLGVSQRVAFGICGLAGICGERVVWAAAGYAKRFGVDIKPEDDPPEKET